MAEPLKNAYNSEFLTNLLSCWKKIIPELDESAYHEFVFKAPWEQLKLKERMSRLSDSLQLILPTDFKQAAPLLKQLVKQLIEDDIYKDQFECMFIPEYVEKHGNKHFSESMDAIELITQYTSCEFAIRPFIIKYEDWCMKQMLEWSKHEHASVRRLSSEGCRPRLPWAMALVNFKSNPNKILPILENLKNDPSLYVRKSVANNLNDISKDHPELMISLAKKWIGKTDSTDWIVKHASRTLLKAGNPEVMKLFGYASIENIHLTDYKLIDSEVDFGNSIQFHFALRNKSNNPIKIRMEYAIYFLKQNGSHSKKVFKISERNIEAKEFLKIERSHPFKPISTRKYYSGKHSLALIINGIEQENHSFLLNMYS